MSENTGASAPSNPPVNAEVLVARLLDGPHTVTCPSGHQSVTWEKPPPEVGSLRQCATCWHPVLDPMPVVSVSAGLPLALVRECLGRNMAAQVLAAGGAA